MITKGEKLIKNLLKVSLLISLSLFICYSFTTISLFESHSVAFAQGGGGGGGGGGGAGGSGDGGYEPNPECIKTVFGNWICGKDALKNFVVSLFNWATGIIGGAAVLMIIYGGFIYMTSAGNEDRISLAKQIIFGALAGVVLIVLVRVIFVELYGASWF